MEGNRILKLNIENMKSLDVDMAKQLVTAAGPTIRYDKTGNPWFPKDRADVAIIQRDAEDGHSYGRTIWYVAYDNGQGVRIKKLHDTGNIHDNCHTWSIDLVDGVLKVNASYGNTKPKIEVRLSDLGLKDLEKA